MSDKDKTLCERENTSCHFDRKKKCEGIFCLFCFLICDIFVEIVFKSILIDQTTIMDVSLSWPKWKGFDLI